MYASAVDESARLGHKSAMKNLACLATLLFATAAFSQISGSSTEREAARRFGESMAAAFNQRDEKSMASLIDVRAFGLRTAKVQGMSPGDQEQFATGLEKTGLSQLYAGYFQSLRRMAPRGSCA